MSHILFLVRCDIQIARHDKSISKQSGFETNWPRRRGAESSRKFITWGETRNPISSRGTPVVD